MRTIPPLPPGLPPDPDHPQARAAFVTLAANRWRLTPCEAVGLWHVCRGVTGRADVARLLGVEVATVADHRETLYRKLRVADQVQAVLAAWPVYWRAWAWAKCAGERRAAA